MSRGQHPEIEIEAVQDVIGPAPGPKVEQGAGGGDRPIGHRLADELEGDVVGRFQEPVGRGEDGWLVGPDPEDLGGHMEGRRQVSGPIVEGAVTELPPHLVRLRGRPVVAVDDAGAKRAPPTIDGYDRRTLAGQADRLYRSPRAQLADQLAERTKRRSPPVVGVLLRPAIARQRCRIGATRVGNGTAVEIEGCGPRAGRPDVDGDEDLSCAVGGSATGRRHRRYPRTSWWPVTLSPSRVTSAPR